MSFTRVKPAGWVDGETLTAAQANSLDTDHAASVDCSTLALGTTKTLTRTIQELPVLSPPETGWALGSSAGQWTTALTSACYAIFPVDAPNGSTITSIYVAFTGGAGHGDLPAVMPTLALASMSTTDGSVAALGTYTDDSADAAAFELTHTIGASSLSFTLNHETLRYVAILTTESGVCACAGAWFGPPRYTATMTALDFK